MREKVIWASGLSFFIFFRLIFSDLYSEGALIGLIFVILSMFWFIAPFLVGKVIHLPSYITTTFEKGKDDSIRIFLFILGLGMYYVGLTA